MNIIINTHLCNSLVYHYLKQLAETWVDSYCQTYYHCRWKEGKAVIESFSRSCHELAECSIEKGRRGCYCKKGYKGDGVLICRGEILKYKSIDTTAKRIF